MNGLHRKNKCRSIEECTCGEYSELTILGPVEVLHAWFGHIEDEALRIDLTAELQSRVAKIGDAELLCIEKEAHWEDPAPFCQKQIFVSFRRLPSVAVKEIASLGYTRAQAIKALEVTAEEGPDDLQEHVARAVEHCRCFVDPDDTPGGTPFPSPFPSSSGIDPSEINATLSASSLTAFLKAEGETTVETSPANDAWQPNQGKTQPPKTGKDDDDTASDKNVNTKRGEEEKMPCQPL